MPVQSSSGFVRPSTLLRRGALALALVVSLTAGAAATPLTLTSRFGLDDPTIATFDTNLGVLQGIRIQVSHTITVPTFVTPDRINSLCSATVTGAEMSISAPGTPVLSTLSPSRPTEFQTCDSFWIQYLEIDWFDVAPVHFDAFTSIGPDSLSLIVSRVIESVYITAYDPLETRRTQAVWSGGGMVTYSYTPVPEPATAIMLTLGLGGMLVQRYRRRS